MQQVESPFFVPDLSQILTQPGCLAPQHLLQLINSLYLYYPYKLFLLWIVALIIIIIDSCVVCRLNHPIVVENSRIEQGRRRRLAHIVKQGWDIDQPLFNLSTSHYVARIIATMVQ